MVTATTGALTSTSAGDGTTSTIANRILVDFKDALVDYKSTSLDVISMFCENMTTDTGGDIDITVAKPSMAMEEIDEGSTPAYQHTLLRNERISVKEWGLATAVTRRMVEDSRFNEVELALNEAKKAVERHLTKHAIYALMGVYDAALGTGENSGSLTTRSEVQFQTFANNPHGSFYGATPNAAGTTRIHDYGDYTAAELAALDPFSTNVGSHYQPSSGTGGIGEIAIGDITKVIELMSAKGANPDTILVSPSHFKNLLDLADFTTAFSTVTPGTASILSGGGGSNAQNLQSASATGVIGSIFGLKVVADAWCPQSRYGIFDTSIKPMAYVERRGVTVEEANPGFGILGSYMSMRYGLKIIRPEAGCILYV